MLIPEAPLLRTPMPFVLRPFDGSDCRKIQNSGTNANAVDLEVVIAGKNHLHVIFRVQTDEIADICVAQAADKISCSSSFRVLGTNQDFCGGQLVGHDTKDSRTFPVTAN